MKSLLSNILTVSILLVLSSCAGYQVKYQDNPFKEHGVNSISIPIFLNKSIIPNIAGPLTKEITKSLTDYTTLKIHSGFSKSADAVLIGIVTSSKQRDEVYKTTATTYTDSDLEESIGSRGAFYVPTANSYGASLSLVLIKKPTKQDMELINSKFSPYMSRHPRVLFTEVISLSGSYSKIVNANNSVDGGGVVNFTQSKQNFEKSIQSLSESAANSFREEILYAF